MYISFPVNTAPTQVPYNVTIDHTHPDVLDIMLEDCGDVLGGEPVLGEDDEERCFTTGPVTNDHQLSPRKRN